ncbi:SDR family oxidoreductase [Streptomyces sp. SS]|uniref:SDR family oxidoreductase n=1 Tax=Streptomyces sp. SS TaxID=260742 RepID=UPI003FD57D4F
MSPVARSAGGCRALSTCTQSARLDAQHAASPGNLTDLGRCPSVTAARSPCAPDRVPARLVRPAAEQCPAPSTPLCCGPHPTSRQAADGFRPPTLLRRTGQPSEIGDAVAYLGSDLSRYAAGTSLVVGSGMTSVA